MTTLSAPGLPVVPPSVTAETRNDAPGEQRILALDGLRGIAILLVLVLHLAGPDLDPTLAHGSFVERAYAKLTASFDAGVDLFFVLSGYLITRGLLASRSARSPVRDFYVKRALRIAPLYYLTLAAMLLVAPRLGPPLSDEARQMMSHQAWLWMYGSNIATGVFHIWFDGAGISLTHFWSLAVEEQFYLVWPLPVLALKPRYLGGVCVALILLAPIFKLACLRSGMASASYLLTPCRFDAIGLGALVAVSSTSASLRRRQATLAYFALCCGGGLLATLALLKRLHLAPELGTSLVHTTYSLLFTGALLLVLAPSGSRRLRAFCSHDFLTFFGRYSYGIYVVHYVLRPALERSLPVASLQHFAFGSRLLALLLFGTIATAISVAAALVSWHLVEKRFLALKRHLATSRG